MKIYVCDKCKAMLQNGPIGAFSNVQIEIQPSYEPVELSLSWHLCPEHTKRLKDYLGAFIKEPDASED